MIDGRQLCLIKCYMVGCREYIARITYASTTSHISDGIQTFRNSSCELLYLDTYQDHHQYTKVTPYAILAVSSLHYRYMMTIGIMFISNVLCIVHHVLWWLIPTVAVTACKAGVASLYTYVILSLITMCFILESTYMYTRYPSGAGIVAGLLTHNYIAY